jgi:hypothetical protein
MTHEEHATPLPDGEELVVLERADVSRSSAPDPRAEWLRLRREVGAPQPPEPAR